MEKRPKNLGNRNRKKKRRNFVKNYLENLWPNYFMDRNKKGMRRKGKKDGKETGVNGKIPQNEEF